LKPDQVRSGRFFVTPEIGGAGVTPCMYPSASSCRMASRCFCERGSPCDVPTTDCPRNLRNLPGVVSDLGVSDRPVDTSWVWIFEDSESAYSPAATTADTTTTMKRRVECRTDRSEGVLADLQEPCIGFRPNIRKQRVHRLRCIWSPFPINRPARKIGVVIGRVDPQLVPSR